MRENVTIIIWIYADETIEEAGRRTVGPDLSFQLVRSISRKRAEIVVFGKPSEVEAFAQKMGV